MFAGPVEEAFEYWVSFIFQELKTTVYRCSTQVIKGTVYR